MTGVVGLWVLGTDSWASGLDAWKYWLILFACVRLPINHMLLKYIIQYILQQQIC
jgi:hypothetical protein